MKKAVAKVCPTILLTSSKLAKLVVTSKSSTKLDQKTYLIYPTLSEIPSDLNSKT